MSGASPWSAVSDDVDAFKRNTDEQLAGRARELAVAALFNEELGAVIQIRSRDRAKVMQVLREAGLGECSHVVGQLNARDEIREVAPGLYLGLMFRRRSCPQYKTFFALEVCTPAAPSDLLR